MSPEFSLFPEQASTIASKVDALYFFALAMSAFFSLLIAVVIFFFFIRFRRRHAGEVGARAHGSMMLEVVWSVIPLVITMVLFVWGAVIFIEMKTVPEDATEYFATAKQWMWKFQHPEGQREINTLHVPLGETIKLTMTSEDVIHSFFVPAFRVKQDVVPGRYTTVWFEASKTGRYHLFCTEYCGSHHSRMIGWVTVMDPDDYQAWLAGGAPAEAPKDLGATLFEQHICNTCHLEDGSGRGPSLVGIYGQETRFTDGTTGIRDDDYLRQSILTPASQVVEGYLQIMPTYQGQLSEVSLLQLISYVKSLGGAPGAETSAEASAESTGESPE
ncbi:MAG: cytochrome c oxidase subunit II [bacterium]|nr:cytochrome c oxidase subunit II [bacterium]